MRVLLADEDAERTGDLARALAADPLLDVVRLPPGASLPEAVARHQPDVVLVDMARPDRDALDGLRRVSTSAPRPVVLFVDEDDPGFMEEAIAAGVCSYNVAGVAPPAIRPLLRAAVALFRRHRDMAAELQAAESRLAERQVVERAKAALIRERRNRRAGCLSLASAAGDAPRGEDRGGCGTPIARTKRSGGAGMTVRLGLLRLADSLPALVAERQGLFAAEGLDVQINVEPSWSNVADKLAFGALDAAVMLPPLALAAAAGLRGPRTRLLVPMALSEGGNSVVLDAEAAAAAGCGDIRPHRTAWRLKAWVRRQAAPPRLAVVHAFSTHALLLRDWLASGGVDPDRDVELVAIPPAEVVDALAAGRIAGFCAGAPWGDEAVLRGAGQVVLGTEQIRPGHVEKCLAVAEGWAASHLEELNALMRALHAAGPLCDSEPEHAGSRGTARRAAAASSRRCDARRVARRPERAATLQGQHGRASALVRRDLVRGPASALGLARHATKYPRRCSVPE